MSSNITMAKFTRGICVLLCLSWTNNASAQRRLGPIALVPNKAIAVAKINWIVVRHDDYFHAMLNTEDLERALSQLDISGDQIAELVAFSGINSSRTGLVGGVVSGSFNASSVNARLQSGDYTSYSYKNQRVYTNPRTGDYFVLLRSRRLAFGSQKAVEGVVDVQTDPRLSITREPPFNSLLNIFITTPRPITPLI